MSTSIKNDTSQQHEMQKSNTESGMSRFERWSLIVQAVGFLLVTLSLLASLKQLSQINDQNRMTVHSQHESSA
jgi:hypothetical protein